MLDTPRRLWAAAATCIAAFVILLTVVYTTERGAAADERALQGFGELQRPRLAEIADAIAHGADPVPFALLSAALVAIAFLRRRPVLGVAVGALLLGANVTTQILKQVLANPRGTFGEYEFAAEAFPSGHATAAMSLALAAVVVAPGRLRPLVGFIAAGFALAVGFAIVSLDWHFPSDIAGGYLVAAAWCFAVLGATRTVGQKIPAREEPYAWWPAAAAMLLPLGVAGWLALERLPRLTG
jgi:membrane-associated phospholipid phosphatase